MHLKISKFKTRELKAVVNCMQSVKYMEVIYHLGKSCFKAPAHDYTLMMYEKIIEI